MAEEKSVTKQRKTYAGRTDKWKLLLQTVGLTGTISFVFYASWWGLVLMPAIFLICYQEMRRTRAEREQQKLRGEFKEALLMVVAALQVGYSVENAFAGAEKDLLAMYGEKGIFYQEIKQINGNVKMNVPLERAFMEFARRSNLEEAKQFGEIFVFAKRAGGDYGKIIRKTAKKMQQKIEVEEEIQTIMTEKQLEMKLMSIMPMAILLYIRLTSPEFIEPMYHNPVGVLAMSSALVVYILAIVVARKIVTIHV